MEGVLARHTFSRGRRLEALSRDLSFYQPPGERNCLARTGSCFGDGPGTAKPLRATTPPISSGFSSRMDGDFATTGDGRGEGT